MFITILWVLTVLKSQFWHPVPVYLNRTVNLWSVHPYIFYTLYNTVYLYLTCLHTAYPTWSWIPIHIPPIVVRSIHWSWSPNPLPCIADDMMMTNGGVSIPNTTRAVYLCWENNKSFAPMPLVTSGLDKWHTWLFGCCHIHHRLSSHAFDRRGLHDLRWIIIIPLFLSPSAETGISCTPTTVLGWTCRLSGYRSNALEQSIVERRMVVAELFLECCCCMSEMFGKHRLTIPLTSPIIPCVGCQLILIDYFSRETSSLTT